MQGEIRLEELVKSFGEVVAVDGIDVDMPPGEFFTMVGPSGCGKTTTLRMIAGFERPTSGRILLDGDDVGAERLDELLEPDFALHRLHLQGGDCGGVFAAGEPPVDDEYERERPQRDRQ